MASPLVRRRKFRKGEKGQTMIEYLLLMSAAFITGYIMVTGPISDFTKGLLNTVRFGIGNVVQHGEWTNEDIVIGDPKHPGSSERLQPLHF